MEANERFNSKSKSFKTDMSRQIEEGNRELQRIMQRYAAGLANQASVMATAKALQEYEKLQYGEVKTDLCEVSLEALQYFHL